MRVLVRPCYSALLKDQLFSAEHGLKTSAFRTEPYVRLREILAGHGIEIATWDMYPRESADILYIQDMFPSRREWLAESGRSPHARRILELWESPLSRPYFFVKSNHTDFDAILTFNQHLCDERRYFHFFLPVNVPTETPPDLPFADRKPLVMINTNRHIGFLSHRQPGASGFPFLGPAFSGWSVPLGRLLRQNHGELYSRRRRLARLAETDFPGLFDIYGPGWRGEKMSWIHRFLAHRPYNCAVAGATGSKRDILPRYRFCLAFENSQGDVGYISEKIFDAFNAGIVPIYLGDRSIADHVSPDAFVDARRFDSDRDLLQFVRDCPQSLWTDLRSAARRYLASPEAEKFTPNAYAQRVADVILSVASSKHPHATVPLS